MYNRFQLAKKYLKYYVSSGSGKGYGIHSPFVFDFIIHTLNDHKKYECYDKIESLRKQLLRNNTQIEVEDFGAGSAIIPNEKRKVREIASSSLKIKKYAQLTYRIASRFRPKTIVELGTSLGITTCYLASSYPGVKVYTIEGSKNILAIAKKNFEIAELKNIEILQGNFKNTISPVINRVSPVDLLFVDGNHRKDATLEYFNIFLMKTSNQSIFIFDDIHWSQGMEEAWAEIQNHPAVTLTIDLFFLGLVFFTTDFKVKQHFSIRF